MDESRGIMIKIEASYRKIILVVVVSDNDLTTFETVIRGECNIFLSKIALLAKKT